MASLGPIVSVPVNWSLDWCDFDDDKTVVPAWAAWHWQRVEKKRERDRVFADLPLRLATPSAQFFLQAKKGEGKEEGTQKKWTSRVNSRRLLPSSCRPPINRQSEGENDCLLACLSPMVMDSSERVGRHFGWCHLGHAGTAAAISSSLLTQCCQPASTPPLAAFQTLLYAYEPFCCCFSSI